MKHLFLVLGVLWFCLVSSAFAEHAPEANGGGRDGRAAAPANKQVRLTGCLGKNNRDEFMTFGLKLGDDFRHYEVSGSTAPNQGIFRTDSDYRGVTVNKRSIEDGLTRIEPLANEGTVRVYPRKRKMNDVTLAGVSIGGFSVQKLFTGSLVMDDLTADGKSANGKLGYNIFTGTYKCSGRECKFGRYPIASSTPGSRVILNYDKFINHRMRVSMRFGDLDLTGLIKFTDTTRTTTDSDGNSTTSVTATQACFNIDVKKKDGSDPVFSGFGQKSTTDDDTARHLLAWWQLMGYDIFSE